MTARDSIINSTTHILAINGAAGMSMRELAKKADIAPSAIYHYFENKDVLLKTTFDEINTRLGLIRANLPKVDSAEEMLRQRIEFQLDHAEEIVAVLKYYLAYRHLYAKYKEGVLPNKAYLHMVEVLEFGRQTGEFKTNDIVGDAQVMTHAVNGFLLEYYPEHITPKDQKMIIDKIHSFLLRSLKGGEAQ